MSINLTIEILILVVKSAGAFLVGLVVAYGIRRLVQAIMPADMPNEDGETM